MRQSLVLAALVAPWLNPFAPGPSTWVAPWLISVLCAGIAWGLWKFVPAPTRGEGTWPTWLAASWLAAALISSVIAMCQYFGLAARFAPAMNVAELGEAFANLRQRNQFASLSSIGLAVLLWWVPRLPWRAAILATVLLAVANAASASRTGLLQIVMLSLFTALWPGPRRRQCLALCAYAMLAYLVAAVALPWLLETLSGVQADSLWQRITRDERCGSRVVLWSNVVQLIMAKPWLGWGWGELDYAHFVTLYPGTRFCDILDNAHNLPLHLAVELGIPATAAICGGFFAWVVRAKPWAETDPTRRLAWAVLAVIVLHSMLEYPLWYGPFQLAFILAMGLLVRLPLGRPLQGALALALVGGALFALWDYRRVSQIYLPPEARDPDYRADPLSRSRDSRLFRQQVRFAELTTTPLTRDNAAWSYQEALAMLHFSPEPRVVTKLIESAALLGRHDEQLALMVQFREAFPDDYQAWGELQKAPAASGAGQSAL